MAMPGEMTDDYHERSRLMSWRTVFMTFGNLMGTKILRYAGLAAFTAVLLFFFSSIRKKSSAAVGTYFGVFSLGTVLFTPGQLWVGRRFEKRRAHLVCMRAYALGRLSWLLATPAEPDLVLYAPGQRCVAVRHGLQQGPGARRGSVGGCPAGDGDRLRPDPGRDSAAGHGAAVRVSTGAPGPHGGLRVWRLTGGDRGAASDGRSG